MPIPHIISIALLVSLASCTLKGEPEVAPLTKPYMHLIPQQATPEGLKSIRAAECGECHEAIYQEWQGATHAVALQDLQFQAELKKDNLWLCINCHTPLENQVASIVTGLRGGNLFDPMTKANPGFDPALREESITCATCHVRDGAIIGAGGIKEAPHPVRQDPQLLAQQICERCHNLQDKLTDTLVCSFNTGDEWRKTEYVAEGKGCVACHMPEVERPSVADGPVRRGHRHTFVGSGIAKLPEDQARVSAAYQRGYDVEVKATLSKEDGRVTVAVAAAITNSRAGHDLPTGDPERFITVDLSLSNGEGIHIWSRRERIGELWRWHPKAEQLSDSSLKAGERREFAFDVKVPRGTQGELVLEWEVQNHRMTETNARAMDVLGKYPLAIKTQEGKLLLPVPKD